MKRNAREGGPTLPDPKWHRQAATIETARYRLRNGRVDPWDRLGARDARAAVSVSRAVHRSIDPGDPSFRDKNSAFERKWPGKPDDGATVNEARSDAVPDAVRESKVRKGAALNIFCWCVLLFFFFFFFF